MIVIASGAVRCVGSAPAMAGTMYVVGSTTGAIVQVDTGTNVVAGGGAGGCSAPGGPLPLTPGQTAKILPSGLAAAPQDAPRAVKLAIAAGNQLIAKPYIYGGGHGQPLAQLDAGYDCSGSTSYVLHGAVERVRLVMLERLDQRSPLLALRDATVVSVQYGLLGFAR